MNGLFYEMLLFLFVIGAVTQGFNELGMFDMDVPSTGMDSLSEDQVQEIQSGAQSTGASDYSTVEILLAFMKVIGMGIVAMFAIYPMIVTYATAMGCPWVIANVVGIIIQAPVTLFTFFALWCMWTGRPVP